MLKFKKVISAVLAVAMLATMSTSVFADSPTPRYIDGDREVEYFDFDFSGENSSEPDYDFSTAYVEKHHDGRNFVVSVNTFKNLNYAVGYCMVDWAGLASSVVYKKGTGNTGGTCDAYAGSFLNLNGRKDSREMSSSPRIAGQFSPDSAT